MRIILPLLLAVALPACAPDRPDAAPDRPPVPHRTQTTPDPNRSDATPAPAAARIAYTMVRDSISGAVLPRLADARDPRARAVNARLDTISVDLRCAEPVDPWGGRTEHQSQARVAYAADSVLSVFIRFSGFCGGAHPINGVNESVTFDLRTGRAVPFRALFANYERDSLAIARVLFPEKVAAAERMTKEEREALTDGDEAFCIQFYTALELSRTYFSYWFTDAGFVVEPQLAHAITPCIDEATVPYERLRPFAAPGGLLTHVAAARAARAAPRQR
jgi:hypothetical protein